MVGYDESAPKRLDDTEYAVAGAISGGLTRAISQPLDVIKIRFQVANLDLNIFFELKIFCERLHAIYVLFLTI